MEQSTPNRNYITSIIIAVVIIALVVGAYMFDHRNDDATGTAPLATTTLGTDATSTPVTGSNPSPSASNPTIPGADESNILRLENYTIVVKSDISGWSTHANSAYNFSLKYPAGSKVSRFMDGKNAEYGVSLTLPSANSHFSDKYFELLTDSGQTTICDALLPKGTTAKTSQVGGVTYIRNEFKDSGSYSVEYKVKVNGICYSANLRLNGATDINVSGLGSNEIKTEVQILEDIMSTVTLSK